MADNYNIYKKCQRCNGTGVVTFNDLPRDVGEPEETTCNRCGGEGKKLWGEMLEQEEE